jgi:hypothetical protein
MDPKQREMDDVIRRVYEGLDRRDREDGGRSLLVLVGDHGMTEVSSLSQSERLFTDAGFEMGNHGGSSEGEMAAVSPVPQHLSTSELSLSMFPRPFYSPRHLSDPILASSGHYGKETVLTSSTKSSTRSTSSRL